MTTASAVNGSSARRSSAIILSKGWSNRLLGIWSSHYLFLKRGRKISLLGQQPFVQHFCKGLHRTIYKRSVAFSARHQHMRGEMLLNELSTERLSFPLPDCARNKVTGRSSPGLFLVFCSLLPFIHCSRSSTQLHLWWICPLCWTHNKGGFITDWWAMVSSLQFSQTRPIKWEFMARINTRFNILVFAGFLVLFFFFEKCGWWANIHSYSELQMTIYPAAS